MPLICITLPAGAWSKDRKAAAIARLPKALHDATAFAGLPAQLALDDLRPYTQRQLHVSAASGYLLEYPR